MSFKGIATFEDLNKRHSRHTKMIPTNEIKHIAIDRLLKHGQKVFLIHLSKLKQHETS